eukprot:scaffold674547_cov50-Prasinocladus_malaysianus.AAC.1
MQRLVSAGALLRAARRCCIGSHSVLGDGQGVLEGHVLSNAIDDLRCHRHHPHALLLRRCLASSHTANDGD